MLSPKFILALFIVSLGHAASASGQFQKNPVFGFPIAVQELSSASITASLQDENGFLWFGTTNGLNRFDGRSIKQYFFNPSIPGSLSNNSVKYNAIYEFNGFIWIGTDKGLNRYNPKTDLFDHYLIAGADSSNTCGETVHAIVASDTITLWAGTSNGLCRLDLPSRSVQPFLHDPAGPSPQGSNTVASLTIDQAGRLWVGTLNGLYLYENNQFTKITEDVRGRSLPVRITSLLLNAGILWLGTYGEGLARLDLESMQITQFRPQPAIPGSLSHHVITSMMLDRNRQLWVGTFEGGMCRFDASSTLFSCLNSRATPESWPLPDYVTSIFEDHEENLWIGTWNNGVSLMTPNPGFSSITYGNDTSRAGLSAARVNAIYEDPRGTVWAGTLTEGINEIDLKTGEIRHYRTDPGNPNSLSNNEIWSITGYDDLLWIGTGGGGINRYNISTDSFAVYQSSNDPQSLSNSRVYSIYLDQERTLWTTPVKLGLDKLVNDSLAHFQHYVTSQDGNSLSSNDAWPIYQDEEGIFWVGTLDAGLNRYDPKTSQFRVYQVDGNNDAGISSNSIIHINGDHAGNLWVGTDLGLNKLDKQTGLFTSYTTEQGLPHNQVSCILVDDSGRPWIGTRRGLSVFDPQQGTFTNYYEASGLPGATFLAGSCHAGQSGKFYFGTESGLVSFWPDSVALHTSAPLLSITEFQIQNQVQAFRPDLSEISLDYPDNALAFKLAALAFKDAQENKFFYRLNNKGEQNAWTSNGNNDFITLANLLPGEYTIETMVRNSAGVSSDIWTAILTVNPPFWNTWWFRGLLVLLFVAVAAIGYRARVNYLLGLERTAHEARLKMERMRSVIAADFHDGIGSGLGGLGLQIDLLADKPDVPSGIREKLLQFRERLNKISDIRQEMSWIINIQNDKLINLVDRIREVAHDIVPKNVLQIQSPAKIPDVVLPMEIRRHLLFLIREALHNAIKHANATKIQIDISGDESEYKFSVIDNGVGFDPEAVERGDGLDNMKFRAKSIGARLQIKSANTAGTEVNVFIKMDDSSHISALKKALD